MNLRTSQPARIAGAVNTFMMLQCAVCRQQRYIRLFLKNPVPDLRMGLHMAKLFIAKHTGLLDDFDRNLGFADIMQQ
ncbi:hypothetical protein D3C80_1505490 [compost metagenome]